MQFGLLYDIVLVDLCESSVLSVLWLCRLNAVVGSMAINNLFPSQRFTWKPSLKFKMKTLLILLSTVPRLETDGNMQRKPGHFSTHWWSCCCENVQHSERKEIITEISRQRVRGLGGERDTEEQGAIQAKEHPTRSSTLHNCPLLHIYMQLLLTACPCTVYIWMHTTPYGSMYVPNRQNTFCFHGNYYFVSELWCVHQFVF